MKKYIVIFLMLPFIAVGFIYGLAAQAFIVGQDALEDFLEDLER